MTLGSLSAGRGPIALPMVCLITDRSLTADRSLEDAVAAAVAGGVTMVQLREKDLPTRELLQLAVRLRQIVEPSATLLVNGRVDVAFASEASGVHLPSDGLPNDAARAMLGPRAIVGRSIHSAAEAHACAGDTLHYVELGTIFPSRSHPGGAVCGPTELEAAARSGVPVLAVGGITPANAADVIDAGASGVAVISAILAAPDPRGAAARLSEAVARAWERSCALR